MKNSSFWSYVGEICVLFGGVLFIAATISQEKTHIIILSFLSGAFALGAFLAANKYITERPG